MIRLVSIFLIISHLSLAATFINAHNHPIAEGENDRCPVYIITHSYYGDFAITNICFIEYVPEQIEYLKIIKEDLSYHIIYLPINNRAPPLSNQI